MKKSYILFFLIVTLVLTGCVFAANESKDFKVSANKKTVKMGESITFKATKNVDDSSAVTFKVNNKILRKNNKTAKVTTKNRKASLKYKIPDGTEAGKVKVTAVSTINRTRVVSTTYYMVEKMSTKFNNVKLYRNLNTVNVTALIKDEKNHKIKASTKVSVKVNGKTLTKKGKVLSFQTKNGVLNASFKLSSKTLSKPKLTLTFVSGNSNAYKSSRYTVNNFHKVAKTVPRKNLTFSNIKVVRTMDSITVRTTVVDKNNNIIKDAPAVYVKVNGKKLTKNGATQYFIPTKKGLLTVKYALNSNLATKTNRITLHSPDTYSYYAKDEVINSIYSNTTRIDVESTIIVNHTNKKIYLNVLASDNKPVKDGKLMVYVNNNLYKTINVNPSTIEVNFDNYSSGRYNVKFMYSSKNYNSSNATTTFIIERSYKTRKTIIASTFVRAYEKISEKDLYRWLDAGLTDVYVQAKQITNETQNLRYVLDLCKDTNIKVHAWLLVFKEDEKWHYTETQRTNMKRFISEVIKIDGVEGVNLDYVRYSGANPSIVNPSMITNFVRDVHNIIQSYDKRLELSACVFAEGEATKTYYGQDIAELSKHLEYIMPMEYRYTYHQGSKWMTEYTRYVKSKTSYAKVLPLIAGSKDYNAKRKLTVAELTVDVKALLAGGAVGYSFFRHGTVAEYPRIEDVLK